MSMNMMTTTREAEQRADEQPRPGETETCPECGGDVHSDAGVDVTCDDCGLVVDRNDVDFGDPEWRYFDGEASQFERCTGGGKTATLHDSGLGSEIGYSHSWDLPNTGQLQRMRAMNGRLNSSQRARLNGLLEVTRLAGAVGASWTTRERAAVVFRDVQEADILQGRSVDAGAAASLWVACREQDLPVLFDDIAEPSPAEGSLIRRTFQVISSDLDVYALPPAPSELIARVSSEAGIDAGVEHVAFSTARALESTGAHCGRTPGGVAAACIYRATKTDGDGKSTQDDIAEAAGVSTMTLRSALEVIASEVPDDAA